MCLFGGPSAPSVTEPTKPQEAKTPEQSPQSMDGGVSDARKAMAQAGGDAGSTLLTGPSGVENSALKLQRTTLLGQ